MDPRDSRDAARELLVAGLRELELEPGEAQIAALVGLAELLASWAPRMNLTGHRTRIDIVRGLVLEAAALATRIPTLASLADVGSGAGFPGLPLALLRPELAVTLIEPRRKRHHFQRAAIRQLGVPNARALEGRAEDLAGEEHAGVVAQAVAPPERVLPWMLPWVEPGGWVLLPGSEKPATVPAHGSIAFEECVRYRVPGGGPQRTLWIGRRRARA